MKRILTALKKWDQAMMHAEEVAEQLANWRGSEDASKRLQVAVYGDDSDLDERVNNKDWHNII